MPLCATHSNAQHGPATIYPSLSTSDPKGNFHFLSTFSALEAAQTWGNRARAAFLSLTLTSMQEQSLGVVGTPAGTTLLH